MPAKDNGGKIANHTGNEGFGDTFNIRVIVQKRLRILKLLEEHVEKGNLKAIELYSKLLSELRDDLRIKEDDDSWFKMLEEMIESD